MPVPARSAYDDQNIFAKILRGEIPSKTVFENEHAVAFEDINAQAPVHVLVIPKAPYVSLADFSEADPDACGHFLKAIGETARALNLEDGGYRVIMNVGLNAHQEVPHLHAHIMAGRQLGPLLDGRFSRR